MLTQWTVGALVICSVGLVACSDMDYARMKSQLNQQLSTSLINKTTLGDYVAPVQGSLFEAVQPVDARDALIYIYRPINDWNRNELQAPSFFVNGQRVYGLKGGGYFWLELPAGDYYFMARRAMGILNFKSIFDVRFRLVGAKAYYFEYDEKLPWADEHGTTDNGLLSAGPLHQRTYDQALPDLKKTILEDAAVYVDHDREPLWEPFELYPQAHNVQFGQLQITNISHGAHDRFLPGTQSDTSAMQNKVDQKTSWMPDWLKHFFR